MHSSIPLVRFSDYESGDPRRVADFVDRLGAGLEATGFVAVADHGVPRELLDRAYAVAARTFALPDATKRRYEDPASGRQRGYTPMGVEHAKDQPIADLKEFWQVGRRVDPEHPLARSGDLPANRFPVEIEEFEEVFGELYRHLEALAHALLGGVGTYLGLGAAWFDELVRDGNSVMRVIHYPPIPGEAAAAGAVRAAAHEDINLMTVLPTSTSPGLELLARDGTWMAVETPPEVVVCDTGDMMQLLTAGRMPATTHRVVNPPGSRNEPRFSMPFFVHPHPDRVLAPIEPGYAPPVRAIDFLRRRLIEIGVASPD